jgi:lipopolysaccharide/colanic/teichoic acid biosynthesis glycosyltransferase
MIIEKEDFKILELEKIQVPGYFKYRRIFDFVVLILLIPFLLPIFLFISIILFFELRGNIIYTQMRAGYLEKPFKIYKFKTMIDINFDEINYLYHNANRETKFGSYLRKHRLDELPQLLNIILGDMSLIGPRPEAYCHFTFFADKIENYRLRKSVVPGLTGWAQINYQHAITILETTERLEYDLEYIDNANLMMDIEIILRTMIQMFTGNNS